MSSRLVNVYCVAIPNNKVQQGCLSSAKYLYAKCDDAITMNTIISAGLDYIVQACIDRCYVILNAQDVLHDLIVTDQIKE